MKIKKISRLLIIIFIISIMIISCDNKSANNSNIFTNIIETDGYGNLTGEIDDDLWSEYWPNMVRTYVGNNITVSNVHVELDHYEYQSSNLIIKNYGTEKLIIYSSISSPFIVYPDSLLIQSNSQEEIIITLSSIDSSEVFQEELIIMSYAEDLITNHDNIIIEVSAVYEHQDFPASPLIYGACPAYPNPASSLVLLPFVLQESVDASLYIRNNAGEEVKLLAEEHFEKDKIYEVIWDLTDSSEITVSPGIYEAVLELGSEEILWTLRVIN